MKIVKTVNKHPLIYMVAGTVAAVAVLAVAVFLVGHHFPGNEIGNDIPVFSFDKLNDVGEVESVGMGAVLAKNEKEAQVQLQREDMRIGFTNILNNTSVSIVSNDDKVSSGTDNEPISIVYRLTDKGMKEEIIIRDKRYISPTFYYLLDLENLRMEKGSDGLWYFFKNNEVAPTFFIPKPYMVDAKGARSENLILELYTEDGRKYLVLKADKSWLLSNERVLPITIDPSVIYDPPSGYEDIVSQRNAQTKTISLGNGKFATTSYLSPVHFQDEDGQWRDISFTIEPNSVEEGFNYQSTNNQFETYFKSNTEGFLAKYKTKDAWLKLKPLADSVLGEVNLVNATVNDNSITYPQIYNGVDLRFSVGDIFLEEFIVNNREKALQINGISEKIVVSGAVPQNQEDGSIKFIDSQTKETVWTFPKPVMYEEGDKTKTNYGLHYKLEQQGDSYYLTKVLDTEGKLWLADSARVYPIVIDASAGPNNPGTVVNEHIEQFYTVDWSNPSNATSSNDQYATTTLSNPSYQSDWLMATDFGFTVPSGATIDGIQADIERKASRTSDYDDWVYDWNLYIVQSGSRGGVDHASSVHWPTDDTYASYGNESDKWGLTWDTTKINASDFGVGLIAGSLWGPDEGPITCSVDHIRMTVYYTEGGPAVSPQIDINNINLEGIDIN